MTILGEDCSRSILLKIEASQNFSGGRLGGLVLCGTRITEGDWWCDLSGLSALHLHAAGGGLGGASGNAAAYRPLCAVWQVVCS